MKQWRLMIAVSMALLAGGVSAETPRDVNFAGSTAQVQQGNHAAIVVGVEAYNERLTGFRKLDYAADDASLISSALQSIGYPEQQIEVLTDTEATKDIVLNRIRQRAKALGKDGTLVFFFSGHGFAQGDENYLATYGAVASELGASGLAVRDVVAAIRQSGVRRAVLLLDACRNDPTPGSKSVNVGFAAVNAGEGIQILLSTGRGEVSWEHPDLQHGVFSHFLANGLRGGKQQFSQLADYVEREVTAWTVSRKVQTQKPFRSGEHRGGDFLLVSAATPSTPQPEPAPEPPDPVIHPEPVQPEPAPATSPGKLISGRYLDNGDGTITDTKTQLTWKKCSEGQSGDNCSGESTKYKWDDAMAKFGKGEWRLPTYEELRTLVYCSNGTPQEVTWDYGCGGKGGKSEEYQRPTIDLRVFPNTAKSGGYNELQYLSSTRLRKFSNLHISFYSGGKHDVPTIGGASVRLVRSGQ